MGLHARSSSHSAALTQLFLSLFWVCAFFLRSGVPAPADEDGHIDSPAPSFISPGRNAHLFSVSRPSLLLPFPFVLPLNLLPSVLRLILAQCGPVAVADIDDWGGVGLVSASACYECMRVDVGGRGYPSASLAGAGFEAPPVSALAAEMSAEEAAAVVSLALAFAPGVPGPLGAYRFTHLS
jgi:hypothetical protein